MSDVVREACRAVAAWRLPPGFERQHMPEGVDAAAANGVVDALASHKLTGLADDAARHGFLLLTSNQREELVAVHRFLSLRVLFLERVLGEVVSALRARGIVAVALKGAALAHLVYERPELRPYADVDVLVAPDRFDEAVDLLVAEGAARVHEEPVRGFVSRFGKSVELVRADRTSIDLHCSLTLGSYTTTIRSDDLLAALVTLRLGSVVVPALSPVNRFLHACLHATVGNREVKLLPVRDVIECLARIDVPFEAVLERAARWQVMTPVADALLLAGAELQLESDHEALAWAAHHVPTSSDRRRMALARRDSEAGAGLAEIWDMVRGIEGLRDKAAYLRALALPSSAYLAERGTTMWQRVVRAAAGAGRRP